MNEKEFKLVGGESPLKQIREALGLSQEAFAREIGTALVTVGRWERGQTPPTFTLPQIKALRRLIRPLGLDIDDLPDHFGPTEIEQN